MMKETTVEAGLGLTDTTGAVGTHALVKGRQGGGASTRSGSSSRSALLFRLLPRAVTHTHTNWDTHTRAHMYITTC